MSLNQTSDAYFQSQPIKVRDEEIMHRIFQQGVNFIQNQEGSRVMDLRKLKDFVVDNFPELVKNLKQIEQLFARMENMFYHLIHSSETPQDQLNKFMVKIDQRINNYFQVFDKAILNRLPLPYEQIDSQIRSSFERAFDMSQHRKLFQKQIREISQELCDNFIDKMTPPVYEKKVIRKIESLVRFFQFLKSGQSVITQYVILKYGKLLQYLTHSNQEPIDYAELMVFNLDALMQFVIDSDFEKQYPAFLHKKDLAVERLHDILKESDENLPEVSPKQIYKQVLNRERRKVYREVYAQIMKNLDAPKDDKKLKEKKEYLETDQVAIVEKMNRIKIEFLRIKSENLFVDIASGKLNEKVVKDTPVTFKNMDMYIEVEKFTLMVNELFQDIQSNLNSMISLKDSERQYFRESFGKVLNNTVLALVNEEVSLSKYGTNKSFPELIASQFRGLRDLIHPHELEKAFQEENQNTLVQEEVGTTNKFMRDVDIYNQRQQLENKKRHFMMQNKLKQDQMKYAQAVAALEKEKKFITKHKIDFPQRDNYMSGNDNRVSENNRKEIEELEEELKGANKNKKMDEDYNQMSNYGKSVYDDIMNERQPGFAREKYENEAKNQYNEQMKAYDNQRQNQMESQRNEREEREKRRQELLEQKKQEYRKKEQEREDAIRQQREQSIQEQEELRRKREQEDYERKEKIRLQREEEEKQRKQRQEEQDRIRKEQIEKENREREERQKRLEDERKKREAEDKERREKQEQERQKREQEEKERREKQEQERRERLEREKQDREAREQQDRERKEKERQEREKREKEDRERREKERKEREEREKQERENRERERKEKEEREKLEREQREKERQLQQQQKEIREKEEREKREQERQLQQQQKEQREREEREKREQERREQQEKEQRERERREQEEKERREKEQREKEEAERLEKELLQKENQAKAQQKGKSSGFNYDEVDLDNDDDDDDYKFDGDSLSLGEDILNDDKKRKSSNKKSEYQSNDYDGYEDDFEIEEDLPDISTNKKNFNSNKTNGGGISALDEIHSEIDEDKYSSQHSQIDIVEQSGNTMKSSYAYFDEDFDMLKATNDYIARTKWGKQNKVQLQGLDNIDSVIQLFEEFIQLGTAFFFDYEHSLNLFQLLQIQDEKEQDETFDEYLSILRGYYNQFTGKMDFESEDMKLYFPFVFNEDNVFNILLIEKNSNKKCVNIFFYDELDQDPQRLEEFQYFVNMFQQLFRCYDEIEGEMDPWEVKSVKISDQTVNYLLENYQEMPYVTYQLLIFSLIYEKNQDKYEGPNIEINEKTAERVFYLNTGLSNIYEIIEHQFPELEQFFEDMHEKHLKQYAGKVAFLKEDLQLDDSAPENMVELIKQLKSQKVSLGLAMIRLRYEPEDPENLEAEGGQMMSYYVYTQRKAGNKVEIGIFTLDNYGEQLNEEIEQRIAAMANNETLVRIERDFTRHNGMYEYSDLTYPLWCHLIKTRHLGPMEALSVINFSMIPYYTAFKSLE